MSKKLPIKKEILEGIKNLNPKSYRIYGIFNIRTKKMLYVSVNKEQVKLEFDLGEYGSDCNVVTANIFLF